MGIEDKQWGLEEEEEERKNFAIYRGGNPNTDEKDRPVLQHSRAKVVVPENCKVTLNACLSPTTIYIYSIMHTCFSSWLYVVNAYIHVLL